MHTHISKTGHTLQTPLLEEPRMKMKAEHSKAAIQTISLMLSDNNMEATHGCLWSSDNHTFDF